MKSNKYFMNTLVRMDGTAAAYSDFFGFKSEVVKKDEDKKTTVVKVTVYTKRSCPTIVSMFAPDEVSFVGVTKVTGDDEFNDLTGLDIAEHKAMVKAYRYIDGLFITLSNIFDSWSESCKCLSSLSKDKMNKQVNCYHRLGKINV